MNERLDLTKILKDCPKGTKLYSPLCGDVEFDCINKLSLILVKFYPDNRSLYFREFFCKDGRYSSDYEDAECMLFPSKENRDWSTFKVKKGSEKEGIKFKAGDYICGEGETWLVIGYNGKDYGLCDRKGNTPPVMAVYVEDKFRLCYPYEVATFKKSLHEHGKHWSKSKNKLVHWYRPFEKVIVRYAYNASWRCCFFSHYDKESNLFECDGGLSITDEENILPYEGNENKVGKITE